MSLVDHKMIIDPGILRPYVSLMFLEYTGERETQDFSTGSAS